LAKGGSAVAESLGGRLVNPNTTHPDERKLRNVIEEMAIAAGVPVPKVYVLDEEKGINAFAAGHAPGDAAIGVTRGCMTLLNRDELQGVIGHEFSHILNGDMRLNLRSWASSSASCASQ
jgi:Zn-dependent protease with chaperone function